LKREALALGEDEEEREEWEDSRAQGNFEFEFEVLLFPVLYYQYFCTCIHTYLSLGGGWVTVIVDKKMKVYNYM
jgi:hypothetical protein